jgi:uncharacterized membrane protein YgcG
LIYHWFKHHNSWNWVYELPLLLLVSQVTSSYTWTYDLVILIPAILQATVWIMSDCKRWSTLVFAGTFLTISILDLVLHMKLSDFWFIWVAPALLIWFLLIRWRYVNSQDNILISEFR